MEEALLKDLTEGFAPTGNEVELHQVIKDALNGYVDEIKVHEGSNSLIAFKKGKAILLLCSKRTLMKFLWLYRILQKKVFCELFLIQLMRRYFLVLLC